jgi:hypothetical protein
VGKLGWVMPILAPLLCCCGERAGEQLNELHDGVESSQRGAYYDVAFAPAKSLAELAAAAPNANASELAKRFARELSMQAAPYWSSGSVTVPALTGVGGEVVMAPAPATSRIRFSCGVTLISPSFAITAGHCPTADTKLDELRLQLYRPTTKLAQSWVKSEDLSGTWPALHHPKLAAQDGYLLDEYTCVVRTRCYKQDNVACMNTGSDVALLECAGRPGDKYGFVNVSTTAATTGSEALMHWKHEVLNVNVADPIPTDYLDHYVQYPGPAAQNFHYFEAENQLLPLRSIPWPDGSSPLFSSSYAADLYGCHGSSGSGMLARQGASAEYRLVGPVALGGSGFGGRLCEQVPNPGGAATGPGIVGLSVNWDNPQALLNQYADTLHSDCTARKVAERDVAGLPFSPGSHRPATLFSHLDCQLDGFAHAGTALADPSFGPYPEKFIDDSDAAEHTVHGFELEANADYRLGLQAQSLGDCAACSAPRLRIGSVESDAAVKLTAGRTLLTTTFSTGLAGAVELGIKNGKSRLAVGGLTFIRQGQVNSFDVPEDRLEAALYALDGAAVAAGPVPMRFVGDGSAGFEALLMPGERMALLRQALGPGERWTVRLGASSYVDMDCGLLDLTGAPLLRTPCKAVFALDDRAGTDPRLAFFVELKTSSSRTNADVTFVALASGQARDQDSDGVPDVLDNCPGDWNPSQGDCKEVPPITNTGAGGAGGDAGAGGAAEGGTTGNQAGTSGTGGTNAGGGADATGGTSGPQATPAEAPLQAAPAAQPAASP